MKQLQKENHIDVRRKATVEVETLIALMENVEAEYKRLQNNESYTTFINHLNDVITETEQLFKWRKIEQDVEVKAIRDAVDVTRKTLSKGAHAARKMFELAIGAYS